MKTQKVSKCKLAKRREALLYARLSPEKKAQKAAYYERRCELERAAILRARSAVAESVPRPPTERQVATERRVHEVGTIEQEIEHRTSTGDFYPAMSQALRSGGRGPASDDSTNITGTIHRTEGDWIGLRLHIMFPDEASAERILPDLIESLKRQGLKIGNVLERLYETAINDKNDRCEVKYLWFDDCGELTRKGRR